MHIAALAVELAIFELSEPSAPIGRHKLSESVRLTVQGLSGILCLNFFIVLFRIDDGDSEFCDPSVGKYLLAV